MWASAACGAARRAGSSLALPTPSGKSDFEVAFLGKLCVTRTLCVTRWLYCVLLESWGLLGSCVPPRNGMAFIVYPERFAFARSCGSCPQRLRVLLLSTDLLGPGIWPRAWPAGHPVNIAGFGGVFGPFLAHFGGFLGFKPRFSNACHFKAIGS